MAPLFRRSRLVPMTGEVVSTGLGVTVFSTVVFTLFFQPSCPCWMAGGASHHRFRRNFSACEFAGKLSLMQNQNAVAESKKFGQLGGDHHDGETGLREFIDNPVDLLFCSHVDASRGLVQKKYPSLVQQPPCKHNLLL